MPRNLPKLIRILIWQWILYGDRLDINIPTLADANIEAIEAIELSASVSTDDGVELGRLQQEIVYISEDNIAPHTSIHVSQGDHTGFIISQDGGLVTLVGAVV